MRFTKLASIIVPVIALASVGASVLFATNGATTICDTNYCKGQFACPLNEASCCCKSLLPTGGYGAYTCMCTAQSCDGKDVSGTICQ